MIILHQRFDQILGLVFLAMGEACLGEIKREIFAGFDLAFLLGMHRGGERYGGSLVIAGFFVDQTFHYRGGKRGFV